MGDGPSPTIQRHHLGQELRKCREAAGKKPKDAAEWLGVSTSTISKIENGRQSVKLAHVRSLVQLYEATGLVAEQLIEMAKVANQSGWWLPFADSVPEWFKTFLGLEGSADAILTYEFELVPGLLQLPNYIEAITRAARPDSSRDEIQQLVALRRARQQHLFDRKPAELSFVLNEAVLCRPVGGRAAWRAQIEHMAEVASMPGVEIRVLPFSTGEHPVMGSAFTLLHFQSEPGLNTVYLENDRTGHHLKRPLDIRRYDDVFEQLRTSALTPEKTVERLATVSKHL